jgi:hypothetical protein
MENLQILGQFVFQFLRENGGITSLLLGVVGMGIWFTRTLISDF